MFFSILDVELNEKFYKKRRRLNPFDKTLLASFKSPLRRWIESIAPRGISIKSILLDTHYMFNMVNDMVKILEVIDKKSRPFFCKMVLRALLLWFPQHTTKEVPIVRKGLHWESFLNTLLTAKVTKHEICSRALSNFLEPILSNDMVCLSIFKGGVVTYIYLICLSMCFCGYPISLCDNF